MGKPTSQTKNLASSSARETVRRGDSPASVQTRSKAAEGATVDEGISLVTVSEERILVKLSQLLDDKFKEFEDRIMSTINSRMQTVEEEVSVLKLKVIELERTNNILQQQFNNVSRTQRLTDAMISGIPYLEGERPVEIVRKISASISHPISSYVDAYRLPAKHNNKQTSILVRFSSALEKKAFIKQFYKSAKVRLKDVDGLGFASDSRIFVSESLTTHNSLLLKKAIGLKKQGNLQKVFTRDGIVCIISNSGVRMKVTHIDELHEVCSATLNGA